MLRWHGTKGDGRGGTESLELHQELIWNKQGIPTSQKRQKRKLSVTSGYTTNHPKVKGSEAFLRAPG